MTAKNGIICFTFDDRNFDGWLSAIPLFKKYGAHASFFISGAIDQRALETARALTDAGHTVGLHTLNHADAPEYFDTHGAQSYYENEIFPQLQPMLDAGIPVNTFAYPNNRRNEATDGFLGRWFSRFRAGNRLSEEKYFPAGQAHCRRVMQGFGVGEFYSTTEQDMIEKLELAARENLCMTFFSHNIAPGADHIHMPSELLEKCLARAQELGISVMGFDEL